MGRPEEVITAELIRQTYGAEVDVHPSPLGGFPQASFLPLRHGSDRRLEPIVAMVHWLVLLSKWPMRIEEWENDQ